MKRFALILGLLFLFLFPIFADDGPVTVYSKKNEAGGYDFYAQNTHIIPVFVFVDFNKLQNLESSTSLPYTRSLEADSGEVFLFSLRPVQENKRYGYSLLYRFSRGVPETAQHDEDAVYLFPYKHGTKHRITQGHNGEFTHFGPNKYALDFDLDTGTEVYAARGGRVIEVKEDSNYGGTSASYSKHANYILIYHKDGSFGNYVHLKKEGSLVDVGDVVKAGDLIGYSGNTGRSSGPHLHFDVRLPTKEGKMESIPVSFLNYDRTVIDPGEGNFYYSYHPGKPGFEVVFGKDLRNSDYADYRFKVEANDKIDLRSEQVDFTTIVFMSNGFSHPLEISLDARLNSMKASIELPTTLIIPAQTEVFVTLLRPSDSAKRWGYSFSYRYKQAGSGSL